MPALERPNRNWSTEKDGAISTIKSSTTVERSQDSKVTGVNGRTNIEESSEKTSLRRVTKLINDRNWLKFGKEMTDD